MVETKRFVNGQEIPFHYDLIIKTNIQNSERLASYRSGIEQILELHDEDFIKTRLRNLLNG